MEIASLILGIISIILSLIPFIGIVAYLPAIIGAILGIVALATRKSRGKTNKAMPIIGIITSVIGMVLALVMFFVWTLLGASIFNYESKDKVNFNTAIGNYNYDYDYDEDDDFENITEYKIGDKMYVDDFIIVIDKIENFEGNEYLKPTYNTELVKVYITVTNNDTYSNYVSKYDFEISNGDNSQSPSYDSTKKDSTFEGKYLKSGESMTGTLCFSKEKNNDDYYIVYDDQVKVKLK